MEGRMNRTGVYMEWNGGIGKERGGGNTVVRRPRREWISNGGSMKGRKG